MAERWDCRETAGNACGPGDREDLVNSAGSSAQEKILDGTGDTWNVTEERSIAAGNWQVTFRISCSAGGGPTNRVTVQVGRYNSGCTLQGSLIINEEIDVTKGDAKVQYQTATQDPGQVDFASGDQILVTFAQTNGTREVKVHYGGLGFADRSYLDHPDEATATQQAVGGYSLGPTGALDLKTSKSAGGYTLGPTGALGRVFTQLEAVGGFSVAPTGALATVLKQFEAVGGFSIAPTGDLALKTLKPAGGYSLGPTGTLGLKTSVTVGGFSMAPVGALGLKTSVTVGEASTGPTGTLGTLYRKSQAVGGYSLGPTGDLAPKALKAVGGFSAAPTGALGLKTSKTVGGYSAGPTGVLGTVFTPGITQQAVGGFSMAPTGALGLKTLKTVGAGSTGPTGILSTSLIRAQAVGGFSIAPTGALETHKWHGAYGRPMYQFDPTLYDPAPTVEFEAVLKTDAGTARARLWNITDGVPVAGSELTATETEFTRKRSAALTLPQAAKEYQAQLGNDEGNTTTGDGAGLIVRQGS